MRVSLKKISILLVPSAAFSAYYLHVGKISEAALTLGIAIGFFSFFTYLAKKGVPRKVDYNLVTAIFHLYSLSHGQTSPADMVEAIAENKEYGFYSKVFQKIRKLAKDFGYGYTEATAQIAETVKTPLKDVLVRCTNVFLSGQPKGYLGIESSTLMDEYSSYYTQAIETLKTIGGIFTTFQSVIVFLIMTLAIMTFFMANPSAILYGYVAAGLAVVIMYFLFRAVAPKENIVYVGRYPPKLYSAMKWSFLALGPSSATLAFFVYFSKGAPYAFIVLGLGMIIPGIFGWKLERYVSSIDKNYPTFLKALGENLASTSDLKAALRYVTYMELGPLQKLVKDALARLKLGLGNKVTLETLSFEAASKEAYIGNRILLDALNRGADPLEIGNKLGNRVVKFMEFRKKRETVGKNFQAIMMIMQPMTVVLLVVLENLAGFLTNYLVGLPYWEFTSLPVDLINLGNVLIVFVTAFMNALILKEVSAGFWGTFFLILGLLLLVSGVTWLATRVFIDVFMRALPGLQLPFPTA